MSNNANDDGWKNILVIYNAHEKAVSYALDETWQIAVIGDRFDLDQGIEVKETIEVPGISMLVAFQK